MSKSKIKLIIAGSRGILHTAGWLEPYVNDVLNELDVDLGEVVSGGAKGVDLIGEFYADRLGVKVSRFDADWDKYKNDADWDKYKNAAGHIRNGEMAKYADALLALWDGESPGTTSMVNLMMKQKKPVFLYTILEDA
jgi:hypothetical protein